MTLSEKERRAYFRVEARLPLRQRLARPEEIEAFGRDLALSHDEDLGVLPRALVTRLERLERKLERVLSLLDPDAPQPLTEEQAGVVELSGSGARYLWREAVELGADVVLEMLVPGEPPRHVRCLARVVRCLPLEEGFSIAVAFRLLDEADRAAIVRYTYDVQRAALRVRSVREQPA